MVSERFIIDICVVVFIIVEIFLDFIWREIIKLVMVIFFIIIFFIFMLLDEFSVLLSLLIDIKDVFRVFFKFL